MIDNTMQAVLGDRKKYMKKLKQFKVDFYEEIGIKQKESRNPATTREAAAFGSDNGVFDVNSLNLDSNDSDSDNSIDRMAGFLDKLKE